MINITRIISDIEVRAIIRYVKRYNTYLSDKTILMAIELCKVNQRDNMGRPIYNFYEAVYYRANQMWLALGK